MPVHRMIARAALLAALGGVLSGCTSLERLAYMHGAEALPAQTFPFKDGGSSLYYRFAVGDAQKARTVVFFYGGSGCPSWKAVMPGYVDGLGVDARVFVLNKRFVADRSTGMFGCGEDFARANLPAQWTADYVEFIQAQLGGAAQPFNNVVLVGVSEGALPAAAVAARLPGVVTHLAIIGSGGYTLRNSLATLKRKGSTGFDVEAGWKDIAADPASLEKIWYGHPYRWWAEVLDLDPLGDLSRLDIPILVGVGERDENMPVESAHDLAARFGQMGKRNLTLKIYPGADHRLESGGHSWRPDFFAALGCLLQPAGSAACAATPPAAP
jgi:pimeloyl-ACP methyl ester carboxylesterase